MVLPCNTSSPPRVDFRGQGREVPPIMRTTKHRRLSEIEAELQAERTLSPAELDRQATELTDVAVAQRQRGTDEAGQQYRFLPFDPALLDGPADWNGEDDLGYSPFKPIHSVWGPDVTPGPEDELFAEEEPEKDHSRLHEALKGLTAEHREVLEASFFELIPLSAYAGRVGIDREAAKKRLQRAKAALRKALAEA
jgi:RNA polymerase sigma factor (sigma-70 family)